MRQLGAGDIADLCGASLLAGDPDREIVGISTDSRTIGSGEMFLALRGERFDGHDFVETAIANGAAGIIGERLRLNGMVNTVNENTCLMAVDDTLGALHRFAHGYRLRFDIPLIAVTGSCGKTTTKDMLHAILNSRWKTVKTEGNLNNLIGTPLTLLRLDEETKAAVIEIASNAPGEIEQLTRIVNPTAGIITNIGPVHLEGLGDIEGVFREKSSLAAHIEADGFMVVGKADVPVDRVKSMFDGEVITFGLDSSADFFATDIRHDIRKGTQFLLNAQDCVRIPLIGAHNVLNALAAIAAANQLGVEIASASACLEKFSTSTMRMEVRKYRGADVINDAYNANPKAVREAISTIMGLPAERRILALGDMLELGEHSAALHRSLGDYIGRSGADLLYVCGEFADDVIDGAREAGMQAERTYRCTDPSEIVSSVKYILRKGDILLIKGSRGVRMEQIVQELSEEV